MKEKIAGKKEKFLKEKLMKKEQKVLLKNLVKSLFKNSPSILYWIKYQKKRNLGKTATKIKYLKKIYRRTVDTEKTKK